MAIYQIDGFQFPSPDFSGVTEYYNVFINNETGEITYTYEGSSFLTSLSEAQRGRAQDASLGPFYNSDSTLVYNVLASLDAPFAYVGSTEPVEPNPPTCDIVLQQDPTDETEQGANDGTNLLSVVSTFGTKEVSINNVDWFASPHTFINLEPGNYVGYGRDANGCTASAAFTIEPFDNPIENGFAGGLPQVEVSPGNISRWNASNNPVVINFFNTPDPAKKNMHTEIEITSIKGVVIGSWSPSPAGYTRADIVKYLEDLVNSIDDFKYDMINYRDINRAASFTIRYRTVWDGGSSVWFDAPQPLYVTYSAKQLGDRYGGNMAEYVPFLTETNNDLKAKFMTLFPEPTSWTGLPFDMSFIFSEYLIGSEVKMRTISLDINKQPTAGGVDNSFLLNNDAGYILASDTGKLIIQPGALPPVSNDGILEQLGINRLMLAGTPAAGVEYFQIQLYTGPDDNPNFVTKAIIIKTENPCTDPFIYIKWLNTLGGWDYWRFGINNITSITTSDGITVDRNVFDWENDTTIEDNIEKSSVKKISVGATVGLEKLPGLIGIHNSIKVMMMVQQNPLKWQTVTINTGSFEVGRAKNKFADIKLTLSLPATNIQRNNGFTRNM